MKKNVMAVALATLTGASCLSLAACGPNNKYNPENSIVISIFNGGYGYQYAQDVADAWNAQNAEATGYTVIIEANKDEWSTIKPNMQAGVAEADIYQTGVEELTEVATLGYIEDLSDVANNPATGETQSIVSKILPNEQKALEKLCKVDGKYYALPITTEMSGIVYDHDIFLDKCFLIADAKTGSGGSKLITSATDKLSAGRDGEYGTMDDGHPKNMTEYNLMINAIRTSGMYTYLWTGKFPFYTSPVFTAITMEYDGYDFCLDVVQKGTSVEYTNPETGNKVTITDENGYEVFNTVGRREAYEFFDTYLCDPTLYHPASGKTGTSHTDAQRSFVYGNAFDGGTTDKQSAFLFEGVWWENEARANFNSLENRGYEHYKYGNRNYRFMTMPYMNTAKEDEGHCFGSFGSLYFMVTKQTNANKMEAIKSWFRMFYQNQWLQNTCVTSNVLAPFDCGMNEGVLSKASKFYQNVFKLYQSDSVHILRKEIMESGKITLRDQSYIGTTSYSVGVNAMLRGAGISTKANATQLFEGTYNYYKNNWSVE